MFYFILLKSDMLTAGFGSVSTSNRPRLPSIADRMKRFARLISAAVGLMEELYAGSG
jgi:hypothetical protein